MENHNARERLLQSFIKCCKLSGSSREVSRNGANIEDLGATCEAFANSILPKLFDRFPVLDDPAQKGND